MANVIITGTSRGIGFEMAQLLANAGHKVLALSRNDEAINQLKHKNIFSFSFDICVKLLFQVIITEQLDPKCVNDPS